MSLPNICLERKYYLYYTRQLTNLRKWEGEKERERREKEKEAISIFQGSYYKNILEKIVQNKDSQLQYVEMWEMQGDFIFDNMSLNFPLSNNLSLPEFYKHKHCR